MLTKKAWKAQGERTGWKMHYVSCDSSYLLEQGSKVKMFCLLSEALSCEGKWDLQVSAESAQTWLFVLSHPGTVHQLPSLLSLPLGF